MPVLAVDLRIAIQIDVEVEEVDNHTLHGIDHCLTVEVVRGYGETVPDVVEIEGADLLLFRVKAHYRIFEQGEVTPCAVIALWCG